MEAKERSKNLLDKFIHTIGSECEHACYCEDKGCQYQGMVICKVDQQKAKQCALICVDDTIKTIKEMHIKYYANIIDFRATDAHSDSVNFLKKVKEEIEKL